MEYSGEGGEEENETEGEEKQVQKFPEQLMNPELWSKDELRLLGLGWNSDGDGQTWRAALDPPGKEHFQC